MPERLGLRGGAGTRSPRVSVPRAAGVGTGTLPGGALSQGGFCDPQRVKNYLHIRKLEHQVGGCFSKNIVFPDRWVYFPGAPEEPSEDGTALQEGASAEAAAQTRTGRGESLSPWVAASGGRPGSLQPPSSLRSRGALLSAQGRAALC